MRLAALIAEHGVDVHDHLDRDDIVPVRRPYSSGRRRGHHPRIAGSGGRRPGPRRGIPVVRGEAGGNTHLLLASGAVSWSPVDRVGLDLGVLTVADGAVSYLAHPSTATWVSAGRYVLRRRREQADGSAWSPTDGGAPAEGGHLMGGVRSRRSVPR